MEKQREDMVPWILGLFYLTTRSRRMADGGHRLNELIGGGRNERVVLPNRPEMTLPAFLDMSVAVRG